MTITAELETISSQDADGSIAYGIHREVISGVENATTAYQLKPEQSGALIVSQELDGAVYRLPTPVAGMWFEFISTVAVTSNSSKVLTRDITLQFLLGSVIQASETIGQSMDVFTADGTANHVSITENGTTTGGEVGNHFIVTAISTTQWAIKGVTQSSGGAGTDPFAAS